MGDGIRRVLAEIVIGLAIALLLVVVSATTIDSVEFVYQGF
jgi:hypothetical protein